MSQTTMGDKKKYNLSIVGMLATCVTHPIYAIKVRAQLGQGWPMQVITSNMLKNEGVAAFYKGLSAALLKQATFHTFLFVTGNNLRRKVAEAKDGKTNMRSKVVEAKHRKTRSFIQMALPAIIVGAVGATIVSPVELVLIRMQGDATLPAAQRRNYANVFHALYRIVADEGVLALWKGLGPSVLRALSFNVGLLAPLNLGVIKSFNDSFDLGETASMLGTCTIYGFCASASSLPFDYVKTQIQTMQPDAGGKYPYTGAFDCAIKTFKSGGLLKFYTGFSVFNVAIASHHMIAWTIDKQIQKWERSMHLKLK